MRAITWQGLCSLNMEDRDFGWTVEMQIRAIKAGLRVLNYPFPTMSGPPAGPRSRNRYRVFRAGLRFCG